MLLLGRVTYEGLSAAYTAMADLTRFASGVVVVLVYGPK